MLAMLRGVRRLRGGAALLALLVSGCEFEGQSGAGERSFLAPAALEGRAVLVDEEQHEALIFDVSSADRALEPLAASLPKNPRLVVARGGGEGELLVLCAGEHDATKGEEPAVLAVLDGFGVARRYTLSAEFNALVQSDDGRYAFLFFDANARQKVDRLLFNPNEVAVVDLSAEPDEASNPRRRSLTSLGGVPSKVVFSPPMEIAGKSRRLAVVLFDSDVALLDLSAPERPPVTVELSYGVSGGGGAAVEQSLGLAQVLFGEAEGKIYLRGERAQSIYVLLLAASSGGTQNDFSVAINQLFVGSPATDMALFNGPAGDAGQSGGSASRLLVVAPSGSAGGGGSGVVLGIDAASSTVTTVPLDRPASAIHLFEGSSPFEVDRVEQRALLYSAGTSSVTFVDLEDFEANGRRSTELLTLDSTYARVLGVDEQRVLLIHQGQGLSVLDLERRAVEPISAAVNLADAIPDPDNGKLWLGPRLGSHVGFLDIETSHPDDVQLDAPLESFLVVPHEQAPKVVVVHPSTHGYFTVLDARAPSRDTAFSVRGFLLDGVLDGRR